MAATPDQIYMIIKLRALGWNQSEIAKEVGLSQQVVGYQLKKLKERSLRDGIDKVFQEEIFKGNSQIYFKKAQSENHMFLSYLGSSADIQYDRFLHKYKSIESRVQSSENAISEIFSKLRSESKK